MHASADCPHSLLLHWHNETNLLASTKFVENAKLTSTILMYCQCSSTAECTSVSIPLNK